MSFDMSTFVERSSVVPDWGWVDDRGEVIDLSREGVSHRAYVSEFFDMDPGYESRPANMDEYGFAFREGWVRFYVKKRSGDIGINFNSRDVSRSAFRAMYLLVSKYGLGKSDVNVYVEDDGMVSLDSVIYSVDQFLNLFRKGYRVLKKSLTRAFREGYVGFEDILNKEMAGRRKLGKWHRRFPVGWISGSGDVHEVVGGKGKDKVGHEHFVREYFGLGSIESWDMALDGGWLRIGSFSPGGSDELNIEFRGGSVSKRAMGVLCGLVRKYVPDGVEIVVTDLDKGLWDHTRYGVDDFLRFFKGGYRTLGKSLTRQFREDDDEFFSEFFDDEFLESEIDPGWIYRIPVGWIAGDGELHKLYGDWHHDEYVRDFFDLGDTEETSWQEVFDYVFCDLGWIRVASIFNEIEFNAEFDGGKVGKRAFRELYKKVADVVPDDVSIRLWDFGRDEDNVYSKEQFLRLFRSGYRRVKKSLTRAFR